LRFKLSQFPPFDLFCEHPAYLKKSGGVNTLYLG
jgi:hypothetical protein